MRETHFFCQIEITFHLLLMFKFNTEFLVKKSRAKKQLANLLRLKIDALRIY